MNVRALRWNKMLKQGEFWQRIGVTQSGGSRYENGRKMPKPVQTLVLLAYGTATERKRVLKSLGV